MIEHILNFILFLVVLVLSIILHEIGHLIFIKLYGGKAELKFKRGDFSAKIPLLATKKQEHNIIIAGIWGGLIPIILAGVYLPIYYTFILVIVYSFGCKHDILLWLSGE